LALLFRIETLYIVDLIQYIGISSVAFLIYGYAPIHTQHCVTVTHNSSVTVTGAEKVLGKSSPKFYVLLQSVQWQAKPDVSLPQARSVLEQFRSIPH
jgi:hypothetical protein